MTKKLFDNGLLLEFEATVVSVKEEDGEYWVELDRTAFAPDGGKSFEITRYGYIRDRAFCRGGWSRLVYGSKNRCGTRKGACLRAGYSLR